MENKYKATIGLEIHAELKTKTKMFCACKNDTHEEKPNVNVCPVCMGHPGTLPVINKEAVKHVMKVGHAVRGKIADFTEWDRKNYFYPDIPKGYQISQYAFPLVTGGEIAGTKITRIHLEEDTAKSSHDQSDSSDHSLVDFNRAGVPLMELVTEPVIHSAEDAVKFAKELQLILRYLGAGDANMEKGEMRVEANISVSVTEKFGTKTEVKNLNSFKAVERAIEFEIKRQIEVLEKGEKVVQETRGWDETKQKTYSQRLKEDSHDYRYFPDPDLPKLKVSEIPEFAESELRKEMGELPAEKRERLRSAYGLKAEDAEVFIGSVILGNYFEKVSRNISQAAGGDEAVKLIKLASNYIISDYLGLIKKVAESGDIDPHIEKIPSDHFAELIRMAGAGAVSSRGAKDILKIMFEQGGGPEDIAQKEGLLQKSDEGELKKIVEAVLQANPKVVEEYKGGKTMVLQYLVGQGMKQSKGSANPEALKKLIIENIG